MTEYVTPMISSVLKKYQTSATKSLQGPALALIKKELLSSPEPHELLHPNEATTTATTTTAATSVNSCDRVTSQIYAAPLPPELSQPILSQPDSGCGELYETRLEGKTIGCFSLGGEMRLCLPQFLNNVLNDFTLEQINRIFDDLGIYCSQCTPDQLVEFKAAKILPSDVKASGLITRTDAERLCAAMLHQSDRNSYVPVESLTKGALSFQVYHKCFGKCEGICTPDMYSYQKPTCIKCLECEGWFSPQKFVGHVHRKIENRTCHWGFDSRNWHDYLHVALDVENREKYQRILDQLKEVELKEMHKAQCELDHKKRKAEMLMEDVLLGPLGLVAPQVPPVAHPTLPASLKHHPHHHHQRVATGVAVAPVPVDLLDMPGKKHKALDNYPPHLDIQYQLLYARCMQQQQQQHQQLELERERERGRERERERERLVSQQLASSAFQPWRTTKPPPAAILHAYNALSALPYACQEPPELQNPERVVSSKDLNRFERSYQPNVALAPRKSILSKERDKERELERQRHREQEQQREQHRELQLHIKQERAATPPAGLEPQNGGGSCNHSSSSNHSNHSTHSNHSNSSNSSSPMPMPKPAPAHLPAPAPPPPSSRTTTPTAAPPVARHVPRSPADEFSAGSNEITSSTSPVPTATAATLTPAAAATTSTHNNHIIATVNQHAKLLPTSSNHHSNNNSNNNNHHHHNSNNHNHNEPSRIRINKNLMISQQQPATVATATAINVALQHQQQQVVAATLPHQSGIYYRTPSSAGYSPTQSSSGGLNLSTHSSNVVSSLHPKQLQQQQQPLPLQRQQQLPLHNGNGNGNGNGHGKPHLGSEFELSTDTDDDSLNGEPDSSAMLPPWELAVEALRDTRPKDRERVLHLLQRLLQENQQYRYNNVQLSELFHKQEAHIVELRDQLQRCRRQLEALDKLRVVPLKQTMLQEEEEEPEEDMEEEEEEEEELLLRGSSDADSNETLTQDQANNNNHNNHNNNNNNTGEAQLKLTNGLRRSPTPLKQEQEQVPEELEEQPPASKRLKLQQEQEQQQQQQENSNDSCKNKQNGHAKSSSRSEDEEEEEEEEVDEEEEEEEEEELEDELDTAEAPHSSALETPPTATTPISPDSAATAGQLFDSSNSSDAASMKKAQMSACQALAKINSNSNHNNNSNESIEAEREEEEEAEAEEDDPEEDEEEGEQQASEKTTTTRTAAERRLQTAQDDSDDDEMPLQQRQQQQQQQQQQQRRQRRDTTPAELPAPMPTPAATPVLMATKASKKQTTPAPIITTATTTTVATATGANTTTTTTLTTNCELQIKKEIV